ncbi:hypothetical protein GCM10007140_01710 [Priestia taiwanensis]|uniref:Uncharacterized protein n=1 Tax=Priestia taiwanensis TaxID=1347902 RepID=A0A917AHY6_9BACI|nr:hypothetical protein GCM10007140_01710 [Priestia taiwanensis]
MTSSFSYARRNKKVKWRPFNFSITDSIISMGVFERKGTMGLGMRLPTSYLYFNIFYKTKKIDKDHIITEIKLS